MKSKTNIARDAFTLLGFSVTNRADGQYRIARNGVEVIADKHMILQPALVFNLFLINYSCRRDDLMGHA